ncbi:KIAA0319L [Cordylochernes scorpioides]|uniref:KIAA0319L n=1 Tax=Cordylochernes scorpioides TaxID=51811 RepID=A0ABY6JUU3_9ARAC|nr:KIAA0319L [Cordylochernes scorpioides]
MPSTIETPGWVYQVEASSLGGCVAECCERSSCEVVFYFNLSSCFLITCRRADLCQPLERTGDKFLFSVMVTVREPGLFGSTMDWDSYEKSSTFSYLDEEEDPRSCMFGMEDECPANEVCRPKNHRTRQGLCVCQPGLERSQDTGHCLPQVGTAVSVRQLYDPLGGQTEANTTSDMPQRLVVSAGDNVTIQLPDNSVTISAYVLPKPPEGEKYNYEWKLLAHPDGDESGTMSDQNTDTLKLSKNGTPHYNSLFYCSNLVGKLRAGVYTFKVTVAGHDTTGEASVNVTVIPRECSLHYLDCLTLTLRVLQPRGSTSLLWPSSNPAIPPSSCPTRTLSSMALPAVGCAVSSDDDKIVKYHWEAVNVPIGYEPTLADSPTLQLSNLIPGSYKFMLMVEDSDGVTNSTYANLTVLKEMDYPPTANAGPDVVIYLPQREVVLNGNLSSDDKGIKAWEWTKSPEVDKPVDLEGTNTPYLHINQLEVGVYKFVLKVTDTADQSSTAEVHVFVKPESNTPPIANAGPEQHIALPLADPLVLDGSPSKVDVHVARWHWEQIQGPKPATLAEPDKVKTKVTGLVPGEYVFKLIVSDDKEAHSEATVKVVVTQPTNSPPRANAGGDKTVVATQDVVVLNGSTSWDDVGIVSWQWSRDPSSLASGVELEDSATQPCLKLANLIPGRYLYRLVVADAQGQTSTDTASLIIKFPDNIKNQVELTLNADIKTFTQGQLESLLKQLSLLLHEWDPVDVRLISLEANSRHANRVVVVFVAERNGEAVQGTLVSNTLRRQLAVLGLEVLAVDTVECQNSCSGHGTCDPYTRRCICKAFWMENILRSRWLGDRQSNCDWSILYVILVPLVVLTALGVLAWLAHLWCHRRPHRYTLLEEPQHPSFKLKAQLLSSDSESDVVFEKTKRSHSRMQANGHFRPNGLIKDIKA